MEIFGLFTLASLVAVIYAVTNFLKNIANIGDKASKNAVLTQVIVWVSAFGVLLLAAQAGIAADIQIANSVLSQLDVASIGLLSLGMGSIGTYAYDFLKAKDNTQSAATPSMLK